jgi:hypothetical protein
MAEYSITEVTKFWSTVNIGLAEQCWEYKLFKNSDGYGVVTFYRNGKPIHRRAHQVSAYLFYGERPSNAVVRHLCNNPACCNPVHLAYGSHQQNMHDMWVAGRGHRCLGETAGKARLTSSDVHEIMRLRRQGLTTRKIAEQFGVHHSTIKRIVGGANWCHITAAYGIRRRKPAKFQQYFL